MNTQDQSSFSAQQEVLQPYPLPQTPDDTPQKRSRLLPIMGSIGGVVLLLIIALVVIGNPATVPVAESPTPTPSDPVVVEPSARERIFSELQEKVNQANPKTEVLAPPPIDMKVEF